MALLFGLAFAVGILLWMYYPVVPQDVRGWILLAFIGIPSWFLLEWSGERLAAARFLSRFGRPARIALAVPLMILFVVVAAYIVRLGQKAIAGGP